MTSLQSYLEGLATLQGQLELVAMILGILSVWYATKNNILVFPLGLISTAIYIYIYYITRVYAFSVLNIYFTLMSMVGWYNWRLKTDTEDTYPIAWCTTRELTYTLLIFAGMLIPSLYILSMTDDQMPMADGVSAGLQVLGMWWMTRRKIDNWVAYIIANIIAIPLCLHSGLYFTALQYGVFLYLAIKGLIDWRRELHNSDKVLPD